MGEIFTGGQSLGLYYTGLRHGSLAYGLAGLLGGGRLKKRVQSLGFVVNAQQIPELVIEEIGSGNGAGEGVLKATDVDELTWTAPGGTEGAAVTIADGETKLLEDGGDPDKWIVVTRDGAGDLLEQMPLALVDLHANAIGMRDVTAAEAAAGLNTYYGLMVWNGGALSASSAVAYLGTLAGEETTDAGQLGASGSGTIAAYGSGSFSDWPSSGWARIEDSGGSLKEIVYYTGKVGGIGVGGAFIGLTVPAAGRGRLGTSATAGAATDTVVCVPGIRIASEAVVSGEIQEIADQETEPSGRTWSTAITSGTGVSLGTVAADGLVGLWVHREIPAGAVAKPEHENRIVVDWTYDSVAHSETYRGTYAIAGAVQYRVHLGQDAQPNPSGTPAVSGASLPLETGAITPPVSATKEFRVLTRYRNAYGIESVNWRTFNFVIDDAGANVTPEVSDPVNQSLAQSTGGKLNLSAEYMPNMDADPADTWRYYVRTDGTDPDPDVDTPVDVGMQFISFFSESAFLHADLGPYPYGTDVRVIVRAYRDSDDTESTGTTVLQATVATSEAVVAVPRRGAFRGETSGRAQDPTEVSGTLVIDAGESVEIQYENGKSLLYVGSTLVWGLFWGADDTDTAKIYLPSDVLDMQNVTISGAGGDEPVEVVSATLLYVVVNGVRRAKIDLGTGYLEADTFDVPEAMDTEYLHDGPVWQRGDRVVFGVWDAFREQWVGVLAVDSAGTMDFAAWADQTLTQAGIEGL